MQKIIFIPRTKAEKLQATARSAIISVHDHSEEPANLDPSFKRLTLCFHDTDGSQGGLTNFSSGMALQVLNFVESVHAAVDVLYVHCQMGLSRSAAIALMLSETLNVPCYKENLPVSFVNYKIYNKLVYRTLLEAAYSGPQPWFCD